MEEERTEAHKSAMQVSAFTAWQSGCGKRSETYREYLRRMGLIEGISKDEAAALAEYGKSVAERIVAADQGARDGGKTDI